MLRRSISGVRWGREALKSEVPGPNFITQGVSPRRDVVYNKFDCQNLLEQSQIWERWQSLIRQKQHR